MTFSCKLDHFCLEIRFFFIIKKIDKSLMNRLYQAVSASSVSDP